MVKNFIYVVKKNNKMILFLFCKIKFYFSFIFVFRFWGFFVVVSFLCLGVFFSSKGFLFKDVFIIV